MIVFSYIPVGETTGLHWAVPYPCLLTPPWVNTECHQTKEKGMRTCRDEGRIVRGEREREIKEGGGGANQNAL